MNRRGFLKYLGAATVVTAAGIELIDTAKTFFLPPAGGWRSDFGMSDRLWIIGDTTTEIWEQYTVNENALPTRIEMLYANELPKIGTTINVRLPPRYLGVFSA